LYAKARTILNAAHHEDPSLGFHEKCLLTWIIKLSGLNNGTALLKVSKYSWTSSNVSDLDGSGSEHLL
jgi:hypothetical protein